jgi:hypothetical protein
MRRRTQSSNAPAAVHTNSGTPNGLKSIRTMLMEEIPQIATSWLWLENKDLLHVNEKHDTIHG